MIRTNRQIEGDYAAAEVEVYDGNSDLCGPFNKESAGGVGEQCEAELYSTEGESLADINDIGVEIEVENIDDEEWEIEKTRESKTVVPANVLLTNDSLRSRPQLFVGGGTSLCNRGSSSQQWGDADDIPGTSTDCQQMPGMKSIFKMYGNVAVRKATQTSLLDAKDIANETQKKTGASTHVKQENAYESLENDVLDTDIVVDNLVRICSRRRQILHKHKDWPLYWDRPVSFQEAAYILTGVISVPESKICVSIPQGFREEGTFVINCDKLDRSCSNNDGLGAWGKPTGRNRYYGYSASGAFTRMDDGKGNLLPNANYIWKCMMRRYENPVTVATNGGQNRFIKKIYSALYPSERKEETVLILITYEWLGIPFNFECTDPFPRKRRGGTTYPHPPPGSKDWQAASFQNGIMAALPATCPAFFRGCPLYALGAVDFNAVASIILGGTIVEPSKICNGVPQGFRDCGTFVIDLRNFYCDAELRRDNNGSWGKPAGNSRYYKIDPDTGDAVRVDRHCKLIRGAEYDVQILSKRYEHPLVNGRFVRKIYTGRSPSNSKVYESSLTLAVLTYYWKGEKEHFDAGPQRMVRIPPGAQKRISMDAQCSSQSGQPESSDHAGVGPLPTKRIKVRNDDERSNESIQSMIYKMEYELLERQAALLDRFEAFMNRLERVSFCLPQLQEAVQQVWVGGTSHDGDDIVHEEEIVENEIYDGEFDPDG